VRGTVSRILWENFFPGLKVCDGPSSRAAPKLELSLRRGGVVWGFLPVFMVFKKSNGKVG